MRKNGLTLALGAVLLLVTARAAAAADRMTGCLDEQAGPQYMLRGDQELRVLALLEPDGFDVQSFAKYVGHKVTVVGTLSSKDGQSMMKVRTVQNVADSCVPPGAPEPPTSARPAAAPSKKAAGAASTKPPSPGSATGCLDEEPGPKYVLRGDQELRLLYELEPEGFPVQNLARFLGHKVEVSGRTLTRDNKPVMQVRSIKSLSDRCTPQ